MTRISSVCVSISANCLRVGVGRIGNPTYDGSIHGLRAFVKAGQGWYNGMVAIVGQVANLSYAHTT